MTTATDTNRTDQPRQHEVAIGKIASLWAANVGYEHAHNDLESCDATSHVVFLRRRMKPLMAPVLVGTFAFGLPRAVEHRVSAAAG